MSPYEIAQTYLPGGWPEDGVCELADAIDEYGKRQWRDSRKMALEDVVAMCVRDANSQSSRGYLAHGAEAYRLAVAIRGLIDQKKENQ